MPTIQELLSALHRDPTAAEEQLLTIIRAVREQEELLAAVSPATRHYFIVQEFGQPTAVLFSNRDSFERFAERCLEQGERVAAIRNPAAERDLLFADLWRCGITRVMLDYAPEYVNLHLSDFLRLPDYSQEPLVKRPVLYPALTGKMIWLAQQMHAGKADGTAVMEVLRELYHAALFMPAETVQADGRTAYSLSYELHDGKRRVKLFTDRRELASHMASQTGETSIVAVRYADLVRILQQGADQLVINPGSGAELVLDAQLLAAAEKAVTGQTEDFTLRTLQECGERLDVTDPKALPEGLRDALLAVMQNHPEVNAAYLREIRRENSLHPSYLVLFDRSEDRGEQAFCRELGNAAMPYLGSHLLECTSYEKGKALAGSTKPFYQKKRFGFWK